ncbi:hypothetical protein CY34DRAFT_802179 [Suillus luteus UH-Slu-Lm8-n1]|uniref:Uncharacterized protein n=1 Tax=Suillus luteus UH-Slu-Lm8-n1 TaxID=930992 RepID=A0A0D0B4X2_9AGAM|nr:hypothetical protein CY34DRAFT_802179 [Suillus luteus UH-Slu-Lm8-n1]
MSLLSGSWGLLDTSSCVSVPSGAFRESYTPARRFGLRKGPSDAARVDDPLGPRSPPVRARPARPESNRIENQFQSLVKICQRQVPPLIKNSAK